jgi:hypothetical protein
MNYEIGYLFLLCKNEVDTLKLFCGLIEHR